MSTGIDIKSCFVLFSTIFLVFFYFLFLRCSLFINTLVGGAWTCIYITWFIRVKKKPPVWVKTLLCSLTERNEWLAVLTLFFLAQVSPWMQQSRMKRVASGCVKVILCLYFVIKAADPQIQREAPAFLFPTDGEERESWIKNQLCLNKNRRKIFQMFHYKCKNGWFHNGCSLNRCYLHLLMSLIQWPHICSWTQPTAQQHTPPKHGCVLTKLIISWLIMWQTTL